MNNESMQNSSEYILAALQSPASEIDTIREVAFSAGDLRLEAAVPALCEQIKNKNISVQEAAEYALRKIRGPKTVECLLPLLKSEEVSVRNVAMDILREIGVDNLEGMRPYLRCDDPDVRIFLADILGHCRKHQSAILLGEALLKDPEVNVRYQAAISLGELAYPESVQYLSRAMHDEEWVQFAVVEALAKIKDTSAVNALIKLLTRSSELVSSAIIDALGDLGDIKVIPLLFNSLEKVSVSLRHKAVKAVVKILSGSSLSLLPAKAQSNLHAYLLEALMDGDDETQVAALQGLSAIGKADASEKVLQFARNIDPERNAELYETAVRTLASIGYNTAIRDALRSDDEMQIMIAMDTCRLIDAREPIEEIKNLFWRVSPELQRTAIMDIAGHGDCSDLPFFLAVMEQSNDVEILKSILSFLGTQSACQNLEDIIFQQLENSNQEIQETALEACINLHSASLNERFKERLQNGDDFQRMMAVYALGQYGVLENITEIESAMKDSNSAVRRMAVESFLSLGSDAEHYLQAILPLLTDEDKDVRMAVIDLLGQIGTPSIIHHLISALEDQNDWVRIRAIEALGELHNTEAVPQLAQILEHANPMVVFKVIESLGKIGGNIAFNVLLGMMDHEDPEIQRAAADAAAEIQARQD